MWKHVHGRQDSSFSVAFGHRGCPSIVTPAWMADRLAPSHGLSLLLLRRRLGRPWLAGCMYARQRNRDSRVLACALACAVVVPLPAAAAASAPEELGGGTDGMSRMLLARL